MNLIGVLKKKLFVLTFANEREDKRDERGEN